MPQLQNKHYQQYYSLNTRGSRHSDFFIKEPLNQYAEQQLRPGFGEQGMHHARANHRQEFCNERTWAGSVKIKSKNKQK